MQRLAVIIVLLLSLVLLAKGALKSWQPVPVPSASPAQDKDRRPATSGDRLAVEFYPQMPQVLPDLKEGYLFNAERKLDLAGEGGDEEEEEVNPAVSDAQVDIEGLEYVGSIIIGDLRRGMVSYSLTRSALPDARNPARSLPDPRQRSRSSRQPADRNSRQPSVLGRAAAPKPSSGEMKHATVDEGEKFFGFIVEQVLPDKIVFEKNGQTVERLLYDPDKERSAPVPRQTASQQTPAVQPGAQPQLPAGTIIPPPGAVPDAPHFAPVLPGQIAVPQGGIQPGMAPPARTTIVPAPPNARQRIVPPNGMNPAPVQRPGSSTPVVRRQIIPGARPVAPPVVQRGVPVPGGR